MPYGSGPCLPAEMGSGTVTCPMALDLASRLRWAPVLPRVPWLQIPPSTEVTSSAATCHMALDITSRLRCAPTLPRVLWLWTSPPG
jgi:hypothetical protein